ncbi:MAG TPA: nucleoside triphosphate pyrophosphohydrolase [Anaeromyxobacteraceae bacterium]|nr:nucleoside triphosphate pyrophosphohydrolase [Anaeromyxobacteraceae bacterium]
MSRASDAVERLLAVMARLRGPDGCPWDREQTLSTLRPYVLEETYEVLEAIDSGDAAAHREELGDLLLQIVFQARIAEEEGRFDFAGVADAISEKLLSRHPHVFGPGATSPDARPDPAASTVRDADGVLRQWAALKKRENEAKGRGKSVLEGVPRELPALARAERLTEKASRVGFDWPDAAGARAKVAEELAEVDEAIAGGDRARIEDELGDLLFAVANLARKLGIAPEEALRGTLAKFVARFEHVESELARRGVPHGGASLDEMDRLWEEAKALPSRTPKSS